MGGRVGGLWRNKLGEALACLKEMTARLPYLFEQI